MKFIEKDITKWKMFQDRIPVHRVNKVENKSGIVTPDTDVTDREFAIIAAEREDIGLNIGDVIACDAYHIGYEIEEVIDSTIDIESIKNKEGLILEETIRLVRLQDIVASIGSINKKYIKRN